MGRPAHCGNYSAISLAARPAEISNSRTWNFRVYIGAPSLSNPADAGVSRHPPSRHPIFPAAPLHMSISEYDGLVARASTTSDVFNAIAEADRREILDVLMTGEKAVGAIVDGLSMSQHQVSKHLRVLSEVGLVRCRAEDASGCTARNPRASGRCTTGCPSANRRGMTGWIGSTTTSKSYNDEESSSDT